MGIISDQTTSTVSVKEAAPDLGALSDILQVDNGKKLLTPASLWGLGGTSVSLVTAQVGTAAALASANPVLVKGQIGYETDTLSFKIGDGSTAYNSLTYLHRGLPVSGEPSTGTPHITSDSDRSSSLVVNSSSNTAGVWSAAVTMTGVPAGAKAAWCLCSSTKSGTTAGLYVEAATGYTLDDVTSGTNRFKYWGMDSNNTAGIKITGMLKIHLDANGQFKWTSDTTNATIQIGSAIDYEM